jgi:cell division protein FtsQ
MNKSNGKNTEKPSKAPLNRRWVMVKFVILWSLVLAYLVITLGFVAGKQEHLVCNQIEVRILDSTRNAFISSNSVKNLLQKKGINLIGKNFNTIDLKNLETTLNACPPIEKTEIYKTVGGKIVIEVSQRNPILRIIDANNSSYYIDNKGYVMRLSGNYTSRVIIANGYIHCVIPENGKLGVLDVEKYSKDNHYLLADLFKLAHFIAEDDFWNAQVQQIFVNASGDFELIPRVGAQVILFGDYSDCEAKFKNLMSLYKNALPVVGWNKYETINLKYKGQVICTKRENL